MTWALVLANFSSTKIKKNSYFYQTEIPIVNNDVLINILFNYHTNC